MPTKTKPILHDRVLFDALLTRVASFRPDVRHRSMFGSPALYVGRRMAICVHGAQIGLRVPEALARKSVEAGRATPFRPYGKAPMREWIALGGGLDVLGTSDDLLRAALAFAEANNAGAAPKRGRAPSRPAGKGER